jgi:hypothetical protein
MVCQELLRSHEGRATGGETLVVYLRRRLRMILAQRGKRPTTTSHALKSLDRVLATAIHE